MNRSLKQKVQLILLCFSFSYPFFSKGNPLYNTLPTKTSLCFLENKGQVTDQYRHYRSDIQYQLSSNGINVFIGNGQMHYQFCRVLDTPKQQQQSAFIRHPDTTSSRIATYRVDITLIGANPNATVVTGAQRQYEEHYYLPQCYGKTVHSYNSITYKDVYPNIDWQLYIKDNRLEYDFIVHPGGKVSDIQMRYDGPTGLSLQQDNSLDVLTPMGHITAQAPHSYEQESGKAVASSLVLHNNIVSFSTSSYTSTLVIDPSLIWGTYYGGAGGAGADGYGGIACNTDEDIYISNNAFPGCTNIATTGSYEDTANGLVDTYLVKFDASGNRLWGTYYGGSGNDYAFGVACDGATNVYITGSTNSSTGIATPGCYKGSMVNLDAFLAKFDNNGTLQWSTYFGGNYADVGMTVTCDRNNNIYLAGQTTSTADLATTGCFQDSLAGIYDAFLAKFSTSGSLLWATYYGGSSQDEALAVATDSRNNIYVGGSTVSISGIATPGSYQESYGGGGDDGFLAKFNSSGMRQWATYFGGGSIDWITGIACDAFDNVYCDGITNSSGGIADIIAFQPVYGGSQDGFLAKFNSNGKKQWATYYGGNSGEEIQSGCIATDVTGCVYITGTTWSTSGIASSGTYHPYFAGGGRDAFLAKFDPSGNRFWGTYYGGSDYDLSNGAASDPANAIYITGYTKSTDSIATPGSFQSSLGAANNAFLAKFNTDTTVAISQWFNDTVICPGGPFNLPYLLNYTFLASNTFTAQLSDAYGSFSSPVNIGSVTSTVSGNISCTIPPGTAAGSGYRIRILSSKPSVQSFDNGFNITITTSIPSITLYSNSPVCSGDTLRISATDPRGVHYIWTGPASYTDSIADVVITPFTSLNAGEYYVTANAPGCASKQDSTRVTVKPAVTPSVNLTLSPDTGITTGVMVTFTATTTNVGSSPVYTWYKNGILIPGITTSLYITSSVTTGDVIKVVVHSSDPCSVPDSVVAVTSPLGMEQINAAGNLHLYPNPNKGSFMLRGQLKGASNHQATITMVNLLGQTVYETSVPVSNGNISKQITLPAGTPNGIYELQLSSSDAINRILFSVNR